MRGILLTLTAAGALVSATVGGIGALHLPAARPALRWLAGTGCPVGEDQALTAADRASARASAMARVAGVEPAPERPALGFVLDHSGAIDVQSWASRHGVECAGEPARLVCGPTPAIALGGQLPAREVVFELDIRQRVVGVSASVEAPAAEALAWIEAASAGMPAPTALRGQAAKLPDHDLHQVAREYRYRDYRASLTATNLGSGRVIARGIWQSVPAT